MKTIIVSSFLIIMAISAAAQSKNDMVKPPVAKTIAKIDSIHGDIRTDNYYWLREKSSPDVISYLESENAYTDALMKPTEKLQETIYSEILKRTKQTDLSVPYKLGEYWYYTRTEEGKQYPIYCRRKESMEAPEQIVLELNELAKGHKFLGLGLYQVSNDGKLLAYSLDTTGFRQYQLSFKDLRTDTVLPDSIGQVNSAAWAADNKTLFYVKEDHAKRPYRFFRHVLGQKEDELLYEENDELYRIWTYRSADKKLIFLMSASSITDEARYVHSDRPMDPLKLFLAREVGHEYSVDHREGVFYVVTNKNAKNFRLVTAPIDRPDPENWKELLPHRPAVKLEGVSLFKNHAVFIEK
jgi:oligopeptidase B